MMGLEGPVGRAAPFDSCTPAPAYQLRCGAVASPGQGAGCAACYGLAHAWGTLGVWVSGAPPGHVLHPPFRGCGAAARPAGPGNLTSLNLDILSRPQRPLTGRRRDGRALVEVAPGERRACRQRSRWAPALAVASPRPALHSQRLLRLSAARLRRRRAFSGGGDGGTVV